MKALGFFLLDIVKRIYTKVYIFTFLLFLNKKINKSLSFFFKKCYTCDSRLVGGVYEEDIILY